MEILELLRFLKDWCFEIKCKHIYIDTSNHWFHWNTGEVMCLGRCAKCGIEKEIKYSIIKNQ